MDQTDLLPLLSANIKASRILKETAPDDLLKFGLIPEFVGRMPVIAVLEALDVEALVRILVEPKNAIVKQYQQLLAFDGVDLDFDQSAIKAIAEEAIKRKTGARRVAFNSRRSNARHNV